MLAVSLLGSSQWGLISVDVTANCVQLSSRKFYYSKQRLSRKFNIVKAHVNHLLVGVVSRSLLLTNVNNSLAFCKRFTGGQIEQEKETSLIVCLWDHFIISDCNLRLLIFCILLWSIASMIYCLVRLFTRNASKFRLASIGHCILVETFRPLQSLHCNRLTS